MAMLEVTYGSVLVTDVPAYDLLMHDVDSVPCSNLTAALLRCAEWLAELAPHFYSKKDLQSAMIAKMPKVVGRAAIDAQ